MPRPATSDLSASAKSRKSSTCIASIPFSLEHDTMFKGVNVLVAGASGLIGSNLVARLPAAGAKVRATVHRKEPVVADRRIEYLRYDLTRPEDCSRGVHGVEQVYQSAAITSGAAALKPTPMFHV